MRAYHLGEFDRILKMYSQNFGVLSGVAKGARRTKSRFGARVRLFNLVDLEMSRGRTLDIITQAEIMESFKNIPADFHKFVFCDLIAKIVLKTQTASSDPCQGLFKLIYVCFRAIDASVGQNGGDLKKIMCFFMARFLAVTGYSPLLDTCSKCNAELSRSYSGKSIPFSVSLGGILCPKCGSYAQKDTLLPVKGLQFIESLFCETIEHTRNQTADSYVLDQAFQFLEKCIIYHTDCRLSNHQYLKKIDL